MKNEQNARILFICPKNTFYRILGEIPGSKAESERTQPQYQLRDHGEHCFTDTIMLNIYCLCASLRYFTALA